MVARKFNLSKEELNNLYWKNKLSLNEIAKELGCSRSIILDWMKKYNILRRTSSESKKKKKIRVKCNNCDKIIWVKQSKFKKQKRFFCSHSCFNKKIKPKEKIKKVCGICSKEFLVLPCQISRKYCSRECYCKSGVHKGTKNPWNRNPDKIEKHSKRMLGKNNPNWHDGISFEPYSLEFNNRLKRKIRKKYNYICQLCGDKILKNTKKKSLCIHHINYDKKNCREENLIPLCNSCNSSVNKSREEWTDYFQNKMRIQSG